MSDANGNGTMLTLEEFDRATTEVVPLPGLSKRVGREVSVKIGTIARSLYIGLLPPPVPGSEEWTKDERPAKMAAYLAALPASDRLAWNQRWCDLTFSVCVAGVIEPPFTLDIARRLGDEAADVANKILLLSGILEEEKPAVPATAEAPAESAA